MLLTFQNSKLQRERGREKESMTCYKETLRQKRVTKRVGEREKGQNEKEKREKTEEESESTLERSVKFRRISKNSRLQKGRITRVRVYLVSG